MFESWFDIKKQSFYPYVLSEGFLDGLQNTVISNINYWQWMQFVPVSDIMIAPKEVIVVEKFKPFMFISFSWDWHGYDTISHFPELISLS